MLSSKFPWYIFQSNDWDSSGSDLSEGELEKKRRLLLQQLEADTWQFNTCLVWIKWLCSIICKYEDIHYVLSYHTIVIIKNRHCHKLSLSIVVLNT